jgi:glycosyltransferase involved in cell wall biosynthesis
LARIAYLVSRFPLASETFVIREMNLVEDAGGFEMSLFSLFEPERPFLHPIAERWVSRADRPDRTTAVVAMLRRLVRQPVAILGAVISLVRRTWRSPDRLVRSLATLPIAAAIADRVERDGITHIHAHFATYPALAAWFVQRLTGASYSFTSHAHDLYVDDTLLRLTLPEATFNATISDYNVRFTHDANPGVSTPVELVRCGVVPDRYASQPRTLPAAGPVQVLTVASLEEYKGHRVLFEALSRHRELDRLHLHLVGGGVLDTELRQLATRLGIADRVEFLGAQPETEVTRLLLESDLFVLPSVVLDNGFAEGIPVALMEALAAELPVVTTRLTGIPELVIDGETGMLATPGDPDDLARVIAGVLADPAGAARRAAAGRQHVATEFDVRVSGQRMHQLLGAATALE